MSAPIGFIGQGWIGKNYANDFEARGFGVVRYGLEPEYAQNKEMLHTCTMVFVAVPTPTTKEGFDDSHVRSALTLVAPGTIVVLKSTLLPGTTERLHSDFPELLILNSPEFLRESNAAYDAAHPERTLIGMPEDTERYRSAAQLVLNVLPPSPYTQIMSARAAELTKYAGNVFLAMKVVYANMLYDLAHDVDVDYEDVRNALSADARIGASHLQPLSASGHSDKQGRGAGGHCFIKDLEALRQLAHTASNNKETDALFDALVQKNNVLLRDSGKDLDLLEGVYGSL